MIIDDSIYYNYDKLLSYNALLSFVIGERGVGKTFGAKDYVLRHFQRTKKKFAWIRRYGSDLDSAIGNSEKPSFFKDIRVKYPSCNFNVTEDKKIKYLYMNNKICGYGMSLRSAESLKGTDYSDVDTIIVDEFLVGDGGSRYIKDEPMYLLSIIDSIARLRKIRVILLGNATSVVNPYFEFFNIHLPYNSEYQTFKDGTIVVNYIKNEKYRKARHESEFGKLIEGTKYSEYAIDNQFFKDNNDFIKKKNVRSKLFFNIKLNNNYYGVWIYNNEMYISKSFNINNNVILTFNYQDHNEKTILMKSRSVFMQNIVNHYRNGMLFFENQFIKSNILELLHKSRIY